MKTQQKWLVVAAAALTFVLTACGTQSSKDSSSSSKQQVWHRMEADVLQTLDPSKASEGVSGQAIIDTMNGLYKYYGHDLQPAMATKIVKPTNNGLTYTFTLRNAKWSDGTPVTAQDFVLLGSEPLIQLPSPLRPTCTLASRMRTTFVQAKSQQQIWASRLLMIKL